MNPKNDPYQFNRQNPVKEHTDGFEGGTAAWYGGVKTPPASAFGSAQGNGRPQYEKGHPVGESVRLTTHVSGKDTATNPGPTKTSVRLNKQSLQIFEVGHTATIRLSDISSFRQQPTLDGYEFSLVVHRPLGSGWLSDPVVVIEWLS